MRTLAESLSPMVKLLGCPAIAPFGTAAATARGRIDLCSRRRDEERADARAYMIIAIAYRETM